MLLKRPKNETVFFHVLTKNTVSFFMSKQFVNHSSYFPWTDWLTLDMTKHWAISLIKFLLLNRHFLSRAVLRTQTKTPYNHFLPKHLWSIVPVILVSRVQYSCRPLSRTQDIQGWKRRRHRLIWDNAFFETYFSSSFELLLTRTLCRKTSIVGELFKA